MSKNQWLKEIGEDGSLWSDETLMNPENSWPSMIVSNYKSVHQMALDGNVSGILYQLRDTYEVLLKVPVIMALIHVRNTNINQMDPIYFDMLEELLEKDLSMGTWRSLTKFFQRQSEFFLIPDSLRMILKKTFSLCNKKISQNASNVVQWRNNNIGHGMLRFEDDADYQKEVKILIEYLCKFFETESKGLNNSLYSNCYYEHNGEKLIAKEHYDSNTKNLMLVLDGRVYDGKEYIDEIKNVMFFDSYTNSKKTAKYCDYVDGTNSVKDGAHFHKKFQTLINYRASQNGISVNEAERNIGRERLERIDDMMMECLYAPDDYLTPEYLVEKIESVMDEMDSGIITVCMERGMGKSSFANRIDNYFNEESLFEDATVRCYHIMSAQFRGTEDFTSQINFNFQHNYDRNRDIRFVKEAPMLDPKTSHPVSNMIEFLEEYRDIYENEKTILVLDGIDELTEDTKEIMDFIPNFYNDLSANSSKDALPEGCYIILLSRFFEEELVVGQNSNNYIKRAMDCADAVIEFRKSDENYRDLLKEYILRSYPGIDDSTISKVIEAADARMLYVKLFIPFIGRINLNATTKETIIDNYFSYLKERYSESAMTDLLHFASTIAILGSLSLKEYARYFSSSDITYRLLGCVNDLSPLLTVTHKDGESVYQFANVTYNSYIFRNYRRNIYSVLDDYGVIFGSTINLDLFIDDINRYIRYYKSIANTEKELRYQNVLYLISGGSYDSRQIKNQPVIDINHAEKLLELLKISRDTRNRMVHASSLDAFAEDNIKRYLYAEECLQKAMFDLFPSDLYSSNGDVLTDGLTEEEKDKIKNIQNIKVGLKRLLYLATQTTMAEFYYAMPYFWRSVYTGYNLMTEEQRNAYYCTNIALKLLDEYAIIGDEERFAGLANRLIDDIKKFGWLLTEIEYPGNCPEAKIRGWYKTYHELCLNQIKLLRLLKKHSSMPGINYSAYEEYIRKEYCSLGEIFSRHMNSTDASLMESSNWPGYGTRIRPNYIDKIRFYFSAKIILDDSIAEMYEECHGLYEKLTAQKSVESDKDMGDKLSLVLEMLKPFNDYLMLGDRNLWDDFICCLYRW